jgi:hypothetical protein
MSLVALALANGALVAALLVTLAFVCSLPFRLDRADDTSLTVTPASEPEYGDERLAA